MEQRSTHLLVVALELGRTNSGHAFSFLHNFKTDPLKMYFYDWYNMHSREIKCKTPTCLLLNKEKQFVAFGFEAENKYAELVMDEEQDDYYFFDRFTMSLYNNENVTLDMVLKDKTGKQCSAVDIFTLSIKVFVNRLLEQLDGQCGMFPDDQIRWVLTVPAPWTDSAKQLMRESAEKAGLHPERLLLVTEPEAAVAYCHYIPTTSFPGSKPEIVIKDPGTSLMVVDLGGILI